MEIKIYECKVCNERFKNKMKNAERFRGSRQDVRKHLREVHGIKGRKNKAGLTRGEHGQSKITEKILSEEFK